MPTPIVGVSSQVAPPTTEKAWLNHKALHGPFR